MRVEYDSSQARKNPYAAKNEWYQCTSVESRPEGLGGAWVFRGKSSNSGTMNWLEKLPEPLGVVPQPGRANRRLPYRTPEKR